MVGVVAAFMCYVVITVYMTTLFVCHRRNTPRLEKATFCISDLNDLRHAAGQINELTVGTIQNYITQTSLILSTEVVQLSEETI